jgi:hypothetical protein
VDQNNWVIVCPKYVVFIPEDVSGYKRYNIFTGETEVFTASTHGSWEPISSGKK